MPFVKLDTRILDSTLWVDRGPRDIFITAILMAEPWETTEPMEQLEVRSLKHTGYVAPPGWYGFVRAAGIGIIRRSLLNEKEGYEALEALGCPDHESRSDDFEGRRLVRVDGGYIVLNFMKYRDRDYGAAERMKRLRERRKGESVHPNSDGVTPNTRNDVTESNAVPTNVTQAESREQRTEKNKSIVESSASDRLSGISAPKVDLLEDLLKQGWDYFLEATGKSPLQYRFTCDRLVMGRRGFEALVDFAKRSLSPNPLEDAGKLFRVAVDRMANSDFHNGKNDSGRTYLDWHQLFKGKDFKPPTKLVEFWLDDARWERPNRGHSGRQQQPGAFGAVNGGAA